MITTLIADTLFDGKQLHIQRPVSFEDGRIIAMDTVRNAKEYQLDGLLTAGFIDTQVNGGGGKLFNQTPELNTLITMVKAHAQFGTTSMLPTLITDEIGKIEQAADAVSLAIREKTSGIIGIHFEGPHISTAKKGIHHQDKIRPLTSQEMDQYCRDDLGVKLITLAPESVDSSTIKTLVEHQVIVSLGHSNASFDQVNLALKAGASGFTHLFNAMSPIESRAPNMVGAALLDPDSWCGLILDGHHIHPASARLAYQAKNEGKIILVTDAMSTIGSPQTQFYFDGHDIELKHNKLTSKTGSLAGSALTMITAVNNAIAMLHAPASQALNMASAYPAEFLGLNEQKGSIKIGNIADLILLNDSPSTTPIHIKDVWIAGSQVF
ncbi:N-acetylglucosamine-6-phosphate deacetylase [Shewanella sp. D64]|uniref:N-acetylglucosamine-6-phosphate deacetylase n=1 Tax=unclassified Shewanella TaxID=196818 RepID=UPI0022BA5ABB|nr:MULTISPECIES: N-acetylglucosamine-6-phosphate deacetylase [unclassified Shewanella]MEC4727979.1 N-acetylglucosamine-6-phosphate deacetylase [Shewanella sp. D64]MEC4740049.1 N-acetylglucosamine-6-phosphate deacetylase [Shewanella sp. E94]WBJ95819.1 N-acetylglucosamine-6-phosphate deacetylase [Shewanella sp. MTB7]